MNALDILVVDSDASARQSLLGVLAREGYRVDTASQCARAIERIDERTYDVVFVEDCAEPHGARTLLSDVRAPSSDGFALLRRLRRLAPTTHVVMTTTRGSIARAVAATKADADYLTKPLAAHQVLATTRAVVRRRGLAHQPDARPPTLVPEVRALLAGHELTERRNPAAAPSRRELVPLEQAVAEFEHDYLLRALQRTDGHRSRAAQLLGISRKSLWAKLKRYGQRDGSPPEERP